MTGRMHPDDLRELARLIAAELRAAPPSPAPASAGMVDVKALARLLGTSSAFVYDHAVELGGVKLSGSPKAPWRFDPDRAREAMAAQLPVAPAPDVSPPPRRKRSRASTSAGVALLPVKRRGS